MGVKVYEDTRTLLINESLQSAWARREEAPRCIAHLRLVTRRWRLLSMLGSQSRLRPIINAALSSQGGQSYHINLGRRHHAHHLKIKQSHQRSFVTSSCPFNNLAASLSAICQVSAAVNAMAQQQEIRKLLHEGINLLLRLRKSLILCSDNCSTTLSLRALLCSRIAG